MRRLVAVTGLLGPAIIRMRVRGMVMPGGALLDVRVVLRAGAVVMVRQRHALPGQDRGGAMHRNSHAKGEHGEKAEETSKHRWAL